MFRPVRINDWKHLYTDGGKLFRALRIGDGLDNHVHLPKERHQRRTILGRELRPILLNVPPNVRKIALVLGNAMHKYVERIVVDGSADFDEVVLKLFPDDLRGAAHRRWLVRDFAKHLKNKL